MKITDLISVELFQWLGILIVWAVLIGISYLASVKGAKARGRILYRWEFIELTADALIWAIMGLAGFASFPNLIAFVSLVLFAGFHLYDSFVDFRCARFNYREEILRVR